MSEFHSALDRSVPGLKALIQGSLKFTLARDASTATKRDWWLATSKAVQSMIVERMIATAAVHHNKNVKRVYYLSLEFLMGRLFSNSLYSAGVNDDMIHALEELGLDYEELRHEEYDMGLGNGGLGRLAACFLDSLATWIIRQSATGFITNMASSGRNSAMAIRSNSPTPGCSMEHPGK